MSGEAERARDICLRQLAVRPRTRAELAATLCRKGIAAETAAEVLDRYDEVGMIDDAAFARAWVTTRHAGRGLARSALAGELRRKGVAPEIVGEAISGLDSATEEETARAIIARKLRSARSDRPEVLLRRLVGVLARKGYPGALAVRVVKDALAARSDTDGFADGIDVDGLAEALQHDAVCDGSLPSRSEL